MTLSDLLKLADEVLVLDETCFAGEWEAHWDGTLGKSSVFVKPEAGGPCHAQVIVLRRGYGGIPPEAQMIASYRTAAPRLAEALRAVCEALDDFEHRKTDDVSPRGAATAIRAAIERRLSRKDEP